MAVSAGSGSVGLTGRKGSGESNWPPTLDLIRVGASKNAELSLELVLARHDARSAISKPKSKTSYFGQ